METYDQAIFDSCQDHPKMECRYPSPVIVYGQTTRCHRIRTDNSFRGICLPPEIKCDENKPCPKIGLKMEAPGVTRHFEGECNTRTGVCEYLEVYGHNLCKYY